jgi:hypothetical protein
LLLIVCITYRKPPLFGLLMPREACRHANSTGVPGWLGQAAGSRLHGATRYVIHVIRLLCNDLFTGVPVGVASVSTWGCVRCSARVVFARVLFSLFFV